MVVDRPVAQSSTCALREFVARHAPDEVTETLDRVVQDVGENDDGFARAASRRVLERADW